MKIQDRVAISDAKKIYHEDKSQPGPSTSEFSAKQQTKLRARLDDEDGRTRKEKKEKHLASFGCVREQNSARKLIRQLGIKLDHPPVRAGRVLSQCNFDAIFKNIGGGILHFSLSLSLPLAPSEQI
jgi:hypothetical protein